MLTLTHWPKWGILDALINLTEQQMEKINPVEKFEQFTDQWSPRIIAELNGQQVKLARLEGAFVWHSHENEDELFYVVKGNLKMEMPDRTVTVSEGELIVVPRGMSHRPVADEECWVMLFEPKSIVNTGEEGGERTKEAVWI